VEPVLELIVVVD